MKLEEIVDAHGAMVRRIATVYERQPDRVEDLVQDVWIAVCQALPRLNDPANLKPYIARLHRISALPTSGDRSFGTPNR